MIDRYILARGVFFKPEKIDITEDSVMGMIWKYLTKMMWLMNAHFQLEFGNLSPVKITWSLIQNRVISLVEILGHSIKARDLIYYVLWSSTLALIYRRPYVQREENARFFPAAATANAFFWKRTFFILGPSEKASRGGGGKIAPKSFTDHLRTDSP